MPTKFIHEPWTADRQSQLFGNALSDRDYPAPIVDHRDARKRALSAYQRARDLYAETNGASGQRNTDLETRTRPAGVEQR